MFVKYTSLYFKTQNELKGYDSGVRQSLLSCGPRASERIRDLFMAPVTGRAFSLNPFQPHSLCPSFVIPDALIFHVPIYLHPVTLHTSAVHVLILMSCKDGHLKLK